MKTTPTRLVVLSALFMTVFLNWAFFRNAIAAFAQQPDGYLHIASLAALLLCLMILILGLLAAGRAIKPVLIVLLIIGAGTAYFMDTYNVIIDSGMINNTMSTDWAETRDLITPRLLLYLGAFGLLPSWFIWKIRIERGTLGHALRARAALILVALACIGALLFASSSFYAPYFREHKALRYYSNPLTPLYSLVHYLGNLNDNEPREVAAIGTDARIVEPDSEPHPDHELVIMVVGETARADRFSLNGYARETTPELAARHVISFTHMSSCGTSTAVSVPCMFAIYDHDSFSDGKAKVTQNVLDILARAGVNVLWRDNNSSSKGVANRIRHEDYRNADNNPVCDSECRDVGMLDGLQAYIDQHADGDILIVLHQMGSHGPAYYKRYPNTYRRFRPTCDTSQLDTCTPESISNTYDNTILYTDHFLGEAIDLLRGNDAQFETALLYVSDHGESLGEAGVYLHGLPYFIAPDAQTHVAAVMWLGEHFEDIDSNALQHIADDPLSHDNLFHTLLGLFEVRSSVYDPQRDILQIARTAEKSAP
ncbi:putative membrane-associated, metal-dependent hydrolase [Thioflavicoccus mobilis 8321]|uniref:Putative membrane-associated, metal-dependent hydrolase n=1 Tax=Thioflavicoccus mobilis 8321 TaxID=765912 RepID=L0GSG0_9GAMM|nr:phosphoethanolamine--lipid A transferase [Thioflavicoccus mobilis]AGA89693.1 putative membrane-associated, metal-dependent hydrolase [Thioflavicoccus mobilis 8321]